MIDYKLTKVKNELNKMLIDAKTEKECWEKIEFPTKKDGTPFAVMSKNFKNATYKKLDYALQEGEYVLEVYGCRQGIHHVSYSIDCYDIVKYMTDEEKIAKTQNYLPKQSFLEQVYAYDFEDIKKAVAQRIHKLNEEIEKLEYALQISDNVYENFKIKYDELVNNLASDCAIEKNGNVLHNLILKTIK